MDYEILARELLEFMQRLYKSKPQKKITDAMHGKKSIMACLAFSKDEKISPGDLSEELNISSARVAAALNGLEDKGFIKRSIDPSDRRKILIEMTEKGKKETKRHMDTMIKKTAENLKELGEKDASEYVRILGRLSEIMSRRNCEDME